MSDFKSLNLNTKILDALEKKGYTIPTPIQLSAIPHLLEGKDILGIAQTGTGKTASFALPILHNLVNSAVKVKPNKVRALILTPTRELASQIADNIKLYSQDLGLTHKVIFGGVNINNNIRDVKKGTDILIATPGRLLDLMGQKHISFEQLEVLVLDEADRMLDMGFINDVKKIIAKLPKARQTALFSATMPKDIAVLAQTILNNPEKVEVTPQSTTVEKIDQRICLVDKSNKKLLLKSILEQEDSESVLVFSRTKHGANRIVEYVEQESITVAAIHGNKSQPARERALNGFRKGEIKVLVATDIAARGIDIPAITHVINFDIPNDPESYVHRIGRTARAGRTGIAISFCDNSERDLLKEIERIIKSKIKIDDTHAYHGAKPTIDTKEFVRKEAKPRQSPKGSHFGEKRKSYKMDLDNNRKPAKPEAKERSFSKDKPAFKKDDGDRRPSSDRPQRRFENKEPSGEKSYFKKRDSEDRNFNSDRPQRSSGNREFSSDRPRRTSGDRPTGFRGEGDRPSFRSDRPQRSSNREFSGDRPNFRGSSSDRPRSSEGRNFHSDRPQRSSGNREFSSDKPFFKKRESSDRNFSSDRPSFGARRNSSDRPAFRGEGDKPSFRGASSDRPQRSSSNREFSGDKPFAKKGGAKRPGSSFGDKNKKFTPNRFKNK